MAYLGNDLQVAFPVYRNIDDISGSFNSSTTSFPLRVSGVAPVPAPLYSQQCLISVGGVVQRPDDSGSEGFRLSGGNIIFASAPTTGADFFGVILAGADYVNAGGNFPSGTAGVPSITFNDDLDTGIYNSGTNQLSVTTGGSERLRIDSAGQIESVSLGTAATPAFSFTSDPNTGIYSPGADQVAISTGGSGRLFVSDNGVATGGAPQFGFGGIQVRNSFIYINEDGANTTQMYLRTASSEAAIQVATNHPFKIQTNNQERLRITSAGLVGVGTSSPSFLIHGLKSSAGTVARFEANGTDSNISVKTSGREGIIGADTSQSYLLNTDAFPWTFWTNNTQRMTITSAGNVGIGTSSVNANSQVHIVGSSYQPLYVNTTFIGGGGAAFFRSGTQALYVGTGGSSWLSGSSTADGLVRSEANLVFATNGNTRAVTIDTSQRVGIGTTSPGATLDVAGSVKTSSDIGVTYQPTTGNIAAIRLGPAGNQAAIGYNNDGSLDICPRSGYSVVFKANEGGTERARIDSSGRLGIGTSAPAKKLEVTNGDIQIYNSDGAAPNTLSNYGLTFRAINQFGQDRGTIAEIKTYLNTGGDNDFGLQFRTQATTAGGVTTKMTLTPGGSLGIGTTSPAAKLHVEGDSFFTDWIYCGNSKGVSSDSASRPLLFALNGSEKARLDTSGRLLVGTSSGSGTNFLQIQGSTASSAGIGGIALRRGVAPSGMGEGSIMGYLDFGPNDGGIGCQIVGVADGTQGTNDYPGRLVFSTTANGASSPTERMRIRNNGRTDFIGTATDYTLVTATSQSAGTTTEILTGVYGSTGVGSGTVSFRVYSNGNVQNTNNSYGAISDIKLKENIADANSQWSDIKALQIRKYNFKEGQTHTQIGLVAQEVELVSPGLVTESPDRDKDGNDLGTVTKSVNYSVLYMKAVKALQEAMERIETLEASNADLLARVSALEDS